MLRAHFSAGLLVAAVLLGQPAAAGAQGVDVTDLNLERLMRMDTEQVHDPSRYVDKLSTSLGATTVITGDEIRAYGFRTLADVLGSIGGFYVTDDRNYTYIGARGLAVPGDYNTRLLVLVDGHRLNDNVFDSVLAGTEFPLDLDLVARLEVIRGAGTAMYGANAFSAVINIVTRRGGAIDGFETAFSAGTLNTTRGRVTFGKELGKDVSLLLSASGYYSGGDRHLYIPAFDTPATNYGVANDADADRSQQLFAKLSFRDVVVRALYGGRRKHVPTASFGSVFNDPRAVTFDSRGFVEAQYGREVGLTGDLLVRAYYDAYRMDDDFPMADALGFVGPFMAQTSATGDAVGSELTFTRSVGSRHRLAFGSEWRANLRQNMASATVDPFVPYLDARHRSQFVAFNAEDEVRIRRGLLVSVAARYHAQNGFSPRLAPRASVVAGPFAGTTIKALVANAVRVPSTFELFYESPLGVTSNPSLGPESIRSSELIAEHRLGRAAGVSLSWYRSELQHLIVPSVTDTGLLTSVNGGADVDGVEAAVFYNPADRVSTHLSYAYEHPRNAMSAEYLHDSPRHLAKARAMFPIPRSPFQVAVRSEYASTLVTHSGEVLDASWTTGATLTTGDFWKRVQLGVTVNNLFDAAAAFPVSEAHVEGYVPQYGRRLIAQVRWRP